MRKLIKWGSTICPFFVLIFLFSCSKPQAEEWKTLQGEALGTTYHITYLMNGQEFTQEEMDSLMLWMNHSLSTYQKNSLVSSFNANNGEIWSDPEELKFFESDMFHMVKVLNTSAIIFNATNGAFDPTAGALFTAWEAVKKGGAIPDDASIDSIKVRVGMDKLNSDPNGLPVYRDSLLQLNFNAIAKGYIVDVVSDFLKLKNIDRYMVEIGGEIVCSGKNPEDSAWSIGVNTPQIGSDATSQFKVLELEDMAMATSGNYRNYFQIGDSILGHTIDPRTGRPVMNNLKSATIMHKSCMVADAYATACMVVGLDSATAWVEEDTSVSAFFIYEEEGTLKGSYVE